MTFDEEEQAIVDDMFLLTAKPVVFAANIAEDEIGAPDNDYVKAVKKYASEHGSEVIVLCAKIEEDLASMSPDDGGQDPQRLRKGLHPRRGRRLAHIARMRLVHRRQREGQGA